MQVERLDHVNIITDRLDESARFYAELLDLERSDAPEPMTPDKAQWMVDGEGRAVIHLNALDCPRTYDREVTPGATTGAVHHVAFRCHGAEAMKARLDARGADYRVNRIEAIDLTQIFTTDPNNVLLELNFFGE